MSSAIASGRNAAFATFDDIENEKNKEEKTDEK
jgi:hypothetical protein